MTEDAELLRYRHELDDDGCCIYCGFDGAEWHWWRYHTYEGQAMQTPAPPCQKRPKESQ